MAGSSLWGGKTLRQPIDVFVTDLAEYERRKDVIGSMLYWSAREGEVGYELPWNIAGRYPADMGDADLATAI